MSDMQQTSTVASDSSAREYAGGKMLSARREGIGIVTFNQPQKHNAVSVDMWGGLAEILGEFATDDSIRVVVLTGAGGRAFVSGADISQFDQQRNNADAQRAYDRQTSVGREKLSSFPKPTIAMIRGYCLGGGLAIAMQTDLRIASPESQFGIPAAKLGIAYGLEGLRNLVSLVGPAHARMIMYTGERFGADEALRIGLINRVVASDELENHVFELAQTIASNAPLSVAASRLTITQLLTDPQERDVDAVVRASAVCFDSEDYREGRAAFLEKRKPQFKGR
ncbi:MAG: enoyl-CoA hydratase/isomerase family protein [Chloroflexi bacterium]|nr:enoyl-CoA hydratase/isomerase family protein [Chloroflexota bacterium]MBV9131092.1 enoyl-CoA hydratase/isomerase family protein [Chloroflexota bacterium]